MSARATAMIVVVYIAAVVWAASEIADWLFPESYYARAAFVITVAHGAGGAFGRYMRRHR